jgi:mRNA-degrading endonuclease RelE of RelBE toxin-antitoxin system
MRAYYSEKFKKAYKDAPDSVKKAFKKQAGFLRTDIRHSSLNAKKYNEKDGVWQARVNRSWRFLFYNRRRYIPPY